MPEPIEIKTDTEFYLGGLRFGAGTYSVKLIADKTPWFCDECHTPLPTRDARCPVHGAPPSYGWCPF